MLLVSLLDLMGKTVYHPNTVTVAAHRLINWDTSLHKGQVRQAAIGVAIRHVTPISETKEDDQDEQVTTTAQIPTFPVPLGVPLRQAWPLPPKFTKKSPVAMGYGEYLKWLDAMRKKRLKGQEEPLWPSLLKV